MKVWVSLLILFSLVTGYVFYSAYINKTEDDVGDAPIHELPKYKLGGTVEKAVNKISSISELQTAYIKYINGYIGFNKLVDETTLLLQTVSNYPFSPNKGYLFSAGFDYDSAVQIYYQSNQEETKTVIYKVEVGDELNKVSIIYNGKYLKLVSATDTDSTLALYDNENNEIFMVVR